MPADGGEPERITWNGGYVARESADGKWLYYSKLWPVGDRFLANRAAGARSWATGNTHRVERSIQGWGHVGAWRARAVLLSIDRGSCGSVSGSASRRCGNGPHTGPSGGKYTPWQRALSFAGRTLAIALAERPRSDTGNDRGVREMRAAPRNTSVGASLPARQATWRVILDPLTTMQPEMDAAAVTVLLKQLQDGNSAAADHLIPIVFRELRNLAELYIRRERPSQTLQPTALGA